jgi:phosphoribosylglycinamide formyltransferase 1
MKEGFVNIAIFASGAGSNALRIIKHFKHHPKVRVALIVGNRKNAGVFGIAQSENIPSVYLPKNDFEQPDQILNLLRQKQIDLIVLAGFLLKIPPEIIQAFPNSIVNIHPSLLPKFGGHGMYGHFVHEAVHREKETESGITIHFVNEHYDEGQIIFQAKTEILPSDTPSDIEQKVRTLEALHFAPQLEKIIDHSIC